MLYLSVYIYVTFHNSSILPVLSSLSLSLSLSNPPLPSSMSLKPHIFKSILILIKTKRNDVCTVFLKVDLNSLNWTRKSSSQHDSHMSMDQKYTFQKIVKTHLADFWLFKGKNPPKKIFFLYTTLLKKIMEIFLPNNGKKIFF